MPLNSLLRAGLVLMVEENHIGVALVPSEQNEAESMLLFGADNNEFKDYLQKIQKLSSTPSCCDLICFVRRLREYGNGKGKITICLIELKGGDQVKKAADQIIQTRDGIGMGLRKAEIEDGSIEWIGLIIIQSSISNKLYDEIEDKLKEHNIKTRIWSQAGGTINLTKFMLTGKLEKI